MCSTHSPAYNTQSQDFTLCAAFRGILDIKLFYTNVCINWSIFKSNIIRVYWCVYRSVDVDARTFSIFVLVKAKKKKNIEKGKKKVEYRFCTSFTVIWCVHTLCAVGNIWCMLRYSHSQRQQYKYSLLLFHVIPAVYIVLEFKNYSFSSFDRSYTRLLAGWLVGYYTFLPLWNGMESS